MEIINSLPKKLSISDDIKNINNTIGTTDISSIGDGTVTGALDTVNRNLDKKMSIDWFVQADANTVTTAGSYSSGGWINTPSNYGVLNVGGNGTYITHEFCDSVNHIFYYRDSNDMGVTWTNWESYATTSNLNTKMDKSYIVAGANEVTFNNAQYVTNIPVTLGFKPSMVIIQSSDPVISLGLAGITDDGFIVNAYCFTGAINLSVPFYYQCTR